MITELPREVEYKGRDWEDTWISLRGGNRVDFMSRMERWKGHMGRGRERMWKETSRIEGHFKGGMEL